MTTQQQDAILQQNLAPTTPTEVIREIQEEVRVLSEEKNLSAQQGENIRANAWDSHEYFNS